MIDLGVQKKDLLHQRNFFFSLSFSFELLLEFNPQLKSCDLCMKSVRVDETDAGLPVIVVLVHSTICTILYSSTSKGLEARGDTSAFTQSLLFLRSYLPVSLRSQRRNWR